MQERLRRYLCFGGGLFCLLLALQLMGCNKGEIRPVEISAGDMCTNCRMVISERPYAVQFIDRDGEPYKFDDIHCMNDFIKNKQLKDRIAAYFVIDFDSRQWIDAKDAYFVTSPKLKSPMGGNIDAFMDEPRAQEAVEKYQGKLLSFDAVAGH